MTRNPKVRVRLVSLQTAEHCCVSCCLFSVSCVRCTVMTVSFPDHSKGSQGVSVDHDSAGPGQAESLVFPGQESLQVQASSFQEPTE